MAGADRMTIEEVVKDVMVRRAQRTLLRAAVEAVCAELMEGEVCRADRRGARRAPAR